MTSDLGTAWTPLASDRVVRAKRAYTTRHLDLTSASRLVGSSVPSVGDVVLAQVTSIGQHMRIEQTDGRRATLFPGDELVVVFGDRYAADQFHAVVPDDLGPCSLVAAGGLAGRVQDAHGKMATATTLQPVGLLADDDGRVLNMRDGVRGAPITGSVPARPVTFAVVGASMNAGKTTAAAHLVRGLCLAGLRVGAAKVTGTGAGGDVWLLSDAGARPVYDFTTAGLPSTYRVGPAEVRRVFRDLTARLASDGCDVVVLEVADGVYQQETAALLEDPVFRDGVDGLLFAAVDALGAAAGTAWLRQRGMRPLALTGVLSSSPLATQEAVAVTGTPVWDLRQLEEPDAAARLYAGALQSRRAATAATSAGTAPRTTSVGRGGPVALAAPLPERTSSG